MSVSDFIKATLLAMLVVAGCGAGTRSPNGAVRALIDAAQVGDRDKVVALLGPRTRDRLRRRAKLAGELAGRREMKEGEMLGLGWGAPSFVVDSVKVLEQDRERAVVELRGAHGGSERFECARTPNGWKVELPE